MRQILLALILLPISLVAQPDTRGKWTELGPTIAPENTNLSDYNYNRIKGTGRLSFIEFDKRLPNRIFTGSPSGGLFVSDDRGASWRNGGTDYLLIPGVSHLQVAPESSDTWFIASGDGDNDFAVSLGVARTFDGGKNWEWINGGERALPATDLKTPWKVVRIRKLLVDPQNGNRLWAVTTEGLFICENALAPSEDITWRKLAGGKFHDIMEQPGSGGRIIVAAGEELWISMNSGTSFNKVEIPSEYGIVSDKLPEKTLTVRMSAAMPSRLYVAYTANEGHGSSKFNAELYSHNLYEREWSFIREFSRDMGAQKQLGLGRAQSIAVDPQDGNTLYWGNVSKVYKSIDGGQTVTGVSKDYHDDLHWICFDPHHNDLYITTDGGLNKSEDGGETWTDLTNGIGVANMYNIGSSWRHPGHMSYGGFDTGNVWRDENGIWHQVFFGDGFKSVPVVLDSNLMIYCSSSSGFGVMDPEGRTEYRSPQRTKWGNQWKIHYAVDPNTPELVYYAAPNGLLRSSNFGGEWELLKEAPEGAEVWEVFLNRYNTNQLYFTCVNGADGIWRTNNVVHEHPQDMTWELLIPRLVAYNDGEPITLAIQDVEPDPHKEGAFWVAFGRMESGFKAYPIPKVLYFNGSSYEDWTGLAEGDLSLQDRKVTEIEVDPALSGRIYIGTSAGVFLKDGLNDTWTREWGLPHAEVRELELHPFARVLRAATFGRGLWEMPLRAVEAQSKVRGEQHWTNRNVFGHVVVKKGAELHLKGETWIAEGISITVEPGAKVYVDGSLEVADGTTWKGFDIQTSKGFLFFKGKSGNVEYTNP